MNRIILWIMILFAYLALSTNISVYNIFFGALVATAVMWLIPLHRNTVNVKDVPRGFCALVVYLSMLIRNVIIGGIQVAALVLRPKMVLKSGVIAVKADCDHELGQALSAHSITLSPGELLVETDKDGTMYIHTLDIEQTAGSIEKEQAKRRYLIDLIFR